MLFMARVGQLNFIGRRRLLERCRAVLDACGHLFLHGEHGVGKTALARRLFSDAVYLPHSNPVKEVLSSLLLEFWRRGWWQWDEAATEAAEVEKKVRRLDQKAAMVQVVRALRGVDKPPVVILDEFDGATATVVRVVREIAPHARLVCCGVSEKPHQKSFLFAFEKVEVARLSKAESEELATRLLDEFALPARDRPALLRHLVEEAQGLPLVLQELVARAARKGDVSLSGVRSEALSGHRTVDMTPGLVVFACVILAARYAVRGLGDADLTVLAGLSAALFMGLRFYAYRLARPAKASR